MAGFESQTIRSLARSPGEAASAVSKALGERDLLDTLIDMDAIGLDFHTQRYHDLDGQSIRSCEMEEMHALANGF